MLPGQLGEMNTSDQGLQGGGEGKGNEFITELSELETLFTSQIHSRDICINENNNLLLYNMHEKA